MTTNNWSNILEGGVRLKEQALDEKDIEGWEIGVTGHFLVDPELGS